MMGDGRSRGLQHRGSLHVLLVCVCLSAARGHAAHATAARAPTPQLGRLGPRGAGVRAPALLSARACELRLGAPLGGAAGRARTGLRAHYARCVGEGEGAVHAGLGRRALRARASPAACASPEAPAELLAGESPPSSAARLVTALIALITGYLPIWILLAAGLGLKWPRLFIWFKGEYYTAGLGLMMLSTALTLRVEDFTALLTTGKRSVLVGVAAHLLLKPALAVGLSLLLGLPPSAHAGLVLLAAAPGAQSASVAVLLARGNVALSVCVVTILNLAAFVFTPILTKALAGGAAVAVDGLAMSLTTMQVVLCPILIGLVANRRFPAVRPVASRAGPALASLIATCFAGSGCAMIAPTLAATPPQLLLAVGGFHVLGSALSYAVAWLTGLCSGDRRVLAILGGMQSSSLAFLLATRHLGSGLGSVASAVSVSTMLLWGMTLATGMRKFGPVGVEAGA
ncbi:sodium bile acid symporter family-domain-containing protein [Pavlovales sp. CCMP2436]|nr:sodium bile acid symporter family-domain-containing protein [Pavlovales sp. CCMP2436]